MKKQRKHYTPDEKVAILRRPFWEKEPISKLCDEVGLHRQSSAAEEIFRECDCYLRAENTAERYITPKDMLAGVSRRSTQSATERSRRRGSSGRFVRKQAA